MIKRFRLPRGKAAARLHGGAGVAAIRIIVLLAALVGLGWFNFANEAPARELAQSVMDVADRRPARKILFVGNSRMFANDMPYMVRKMADSAGAPEKYQVTMWAQPGRTLKMHWNEKRARSLMQDRQWDDFVFQAGSVEQWNEKTRADFFRYGAGFVEEAKVRGARPLMIVGWVYGPSEFEGRPADAQQIYFDFMQYDHWRLQQKTGVVTVNVGAMFKIMTDRGSPIPLMTDDNHPSLQGSYISALMTYAQLSGTDGSNVTYVPPGMTRAEAARIRSAVRAILQQPKV